MGKNIFPGHYLRAKVMSIRPECGNYKKDGHSRKKKDACSAIFTLIFEKAVKHCHRNISKPQKVRDHKRFAKRNEIINPNMDNRLGMGDSSFKKSKPKAINKGINNKRYGMLIFFIKIFHNILTNIKTLIFPFHRSV